jgi:hypothetical protein
MSYEPNNQDVYAIKNQGLRQLLTIVIGLSIGILIFSIFVREPLISLIENTLWFITLFTNPSVAPISTPAAHF